MAGFDLNAYRQQYGIVNHASDVNPGYSQGVVKNAPADKSVGHFLGSAGTSAAQIGGAALSAIGHSAVDGFTGLARGLGNDLQLHQQRGQLDAMNQQLQARQDKLIQLHKAGVLTRDQYGSGMRQLLKDSQGAHDKQVKFTNDTQDKYYSRLQGLGDVASAGSALATVLAPEVAIPARLAKAGLAGKAATAAFDVAGTGKGLGIGKGVTKVATSLPGKLARNAIVTQPTVQLPGQIAKDVANRDYGHLALDAGTLAAPATLKLAGKVGGKVAQAVFNKPVLFDALKVKAADGTTHSYNDYLAGLAKDVQAGKMTKGQYQTVLNKAQVAHDNILAETDGNVGKAVEKINAHQVESGRPLDTLTGQQFTSDLGNLQQAGKAFQKTASGANGSQFVRYTQGANGLEATPLTEAEAARVKPARFNPEDKKAVLGALDNAQTTEEAKSAIGSLGRNSFMKIENVRSQIEGQLQSGLPLADVKRNIARITSPTEIFVKDAEGNITKAKTVKGYFPTIAPEGASQFKTAAEAGPLPKPSPGGKLSGVGDVIRNAGISPEATNREAAIVALKQNFSDQIDKLPGLSGKGDSIFTALSKKLDDSSAQDARLLSRGEIGKVLTQLKIDPAKASDIRRALDNAHLKLPTKYTGAGGKLTDLLIKALPLEREMLRVQSVGRFGKFNLPFQAKVIGKGQGIAQAASGGHNPFGKVDPEIDKYISTNFGKVKEGSINDFVGNIPKARPGIVGGTLQHAAGRMMQQMLQNHNVALKDLENNPALQHEINHSIETVFGYPRGGFTDSNLAKTMNVLLFPFRFDAKVGIAAGKYLVKQDPLTRVALVNGIGKAHDYLSSPEGQKWAQKNSELVSIAKYFTPVQTVGHFVDALEGKSDGVHLQDLGLLGGLPLGFVSSILNGQGIDLGPLGSSPYRDPKTGEIVPKQIPADQASRIKQGLVDFASSLFSYPGKTLGLNSKSKIVKDLIPGGSSIKMVSKDGSPAPSANAKKFSQTPAPQAKVGSLMKAPVARPIEPIYKAKKAGSIPLDKFGNRKRHSRTIGPR